MILMPDETPDETPDDTIEELLDSIQKLTDDQLKAIQDAIYLGMTPKAVGECELRRQLISALVNRVARLSKQPRINVTPPTLPYKKAA